MPVGPFAFRYQGNGATPCHYIDTTQKAIDCAITAAESCYIMKLCSRFSSLIEGRKVCCYLNLSSFGQFRDCRNCPKDDKFKYFIPILRTFVRDGVEPRLMARWKARVEFLLNVLNVFFCLLR